MSYSSILEQFKTALPCVRSVVFCDYEGEAIELATDLDSYHTQLLGAYQAETIHGLASLHREQKLGKIGMLRVETDGTFWSIVMLKEGYYVVVMSSREIAESHPALRRLTRELNQQL